MKAFLTVIGRDKVGIVAAISDELFKLNVNIIDITQTLMYEFFTMVVMVDLEKSPKSFEEKLNKLYKKRRRIYRGRDKNSKRRNL